MLIIKSQENTLFIIIFTFFLLYNVQENCYNKIIKIFYRGIDYEIFSIAVRWYGR